MSQDESRAERDYREGYADGLAEHDPDPTRVAYGANRCNHYERGYIDSGKAPRAESGSGVRRDRV